MKQRLLIFMLFIAVLLAACAGPGRPVATTLPAQTQTPGEQQAAPQATQAAQKALSELLGVSLDAIKLEKIEDAEWPNGCLGLPEPDELCTEALVPGYRFTFTVNGQSYEVRTNLDGQVARVATEQNNSPVGGQPAVVEILRQRLVKQLGIALDQIQVTSVESVEWPDGCLGLGGPTESCLMAIVPGYRITLTANGTTYVFRTDEDGSQVREEAGAALPVGAGEQDVVISWNREGGIAGFCDTLYVYRRFALASSCKNNNTEKRVVLSPEQAITLAGWIKRFGAFTIEQQDPAVADAMSINLIFAGTGSEVPSDADRAAVLEFAEQIYASNNP